MLRFGSGLTLARAFNHIAFRGDNLIVGRVLGVVPLGFNSRAFKLMLLPVTYFAIIVTKVLFPVTAPLQGTPERKRTVRKLALHGLGLGALAVLGITSAATAGVIGASMLLRPSIVGEHGRHAARLFAAALAAKLPPQGVSWLHGFSENLERRWADSGGA